MLWRVCVGSAWAVVIGAAELTLVLARRPGSQEASIRAASSDLWDDLPGVEVVEEPDVPLLAEWHPDHRLTAAYHRLTSALLRRRRAAASATAGR